MIQLGQLFQIMRSIFKIQIFVLAFLLVLVSNGQNPLKAQTNDSLDYEKEFSDIWNLPLSVKERLVRLDSMINTIDYYVSDVPLILRHRLMDLADKNEEYYELGINQNVVGIFFSNKFSNYDSAFYYWQAALSSFKKINDLKMQAKSHGYIRYAYTEFKEFDKALEHCYEALAIFEKLDDQLGIGSNYNDITDVLIATEDYQEGLEFSIKGIEILEQQDDVFELGNAYEKQAECYFHLGDTLNAFKAFDKALETIRLLPPEDAPYYEAEFLFWLGEMYAQLGQLDRALATYQKALNIEAAEGMDALYQVGFYTYVADVHFKKEEFQTALDYYKQYEATLPEDKSIYEKIANCYNGLGQYQIAFNYQRNFQIYQDSIQQRGALVKMERLKTEFETEKKEEQIAQQESQIKQQRQVQLLSFGILALLGLLLVGLFIIYRKNQAKNQKLEQLNSDLATKNEQNVTLVKEIHHRVKNNLQILSSLLSLQSDYIKDTAALDAVMEGRNRVQSMGLIHQKLYTEENLASVNMQTYIHDLTDHLLDSFGFNGQVSIKAVSDVPPLDVDTAIPLGLIINELVTNSLKYAFPDKQKGLIQVNLWIDLENNLCLSVKDNGVGALAQNNKQNSTSFGTDLIKILSKKLKGNIQQSSENGFLTNIQFNRYQKGYAFT